MSNNYLRNCSRGKKATRTTISLDGEIETKILKLHKILHEYIDEEWSMSKVINMLLLGGIVASERMNLQDWDLVKKFAEGSRYDLEEIIIEEYAMTLSALRQMV